MVNHQDPACHGRPAPVDVRDDQESGRAGATQLRHQLARTSAGPWGLTGFKQPLNKNGYGPVRGKYLVRQTAIIIGSDQRRWGVSIEVLAPSLAAGQRDLTKITSWMRSKVSMRDVPAKTC